MENNFNNADDTRSFLINELKKQLVGPQDGHFTSNIPSFQFSPNNSNNHKQEILPKNPRSIYTAGILFPQAAKVAEEEKIDEYNEEELLLDEDSLENSKENTSSSLEDDDTDKTSDNNFDLDLTNELRASAIGFSVLVDSNEKYLVGVQDIGKYSKLGKEPSKNLLLVCYYLSREKESYEWFANQFKLENNKQVTCHKYLEKYFSVSNIKMKYRDYFDKYSDNRVGWKRADPKLDEIVNEFQSFSKIQLEDKVRNAINLGENSIVSKEEPLDGYARTSISAAIEIKPDDFNNKIINKNLTHNNNEIGLRVSIIVRPHKKKNRKFLTISLVNSNLAKKDKILVSKCFFQSNLFIKSKIKDKNPFYSFDQTNLEKFSEEEKALHLLHHNRKSYAIGHGCATTWYNDDDNFIIKSETIPVYETKPIKAKNFPDLNLDMKLFSEDILFAIEESKKLTHKYLSWLETETKKGDEFFDPIFKEASKGNILKCKKILNRINAGIATLEINKNAQEAFKFMNKSMYLQQIHYLITNYSADLNYEKELKDKFKGKWRPFQLAFILLNINSLINPESEDRKIMDLIWFPTGGGKTEAYLGLTSFTIFLRKLISSDEKGCAVLMRYTLRLLTTQQFQRAASLICACEKIRRENQNILGNEEISLGLWIGKESTPNREKEASDLLNSLYANPKDLTKNKFILLNCPWCNEELAPPQVRPKGYKIIKKNFHYVCSNKSCSFSTDKTRLPITVIDDRIYSNPPTLLIGTIDKFASIPWRHEAISMFDNSSFTKPDLIIQDELHLISGPLGSIAGMYEILLSALTEKKINNKLIGAKIIGSTATISRAEKQVRNLYGLECNIFPPQTNQLEDSFFSYEAKDEVGRKYIGVFCPSATSPQVTLARVISTMCLAANEARILSKNKNKIYDPYWTNLIYFNSIRELMGGSALIQADVKGNLRGEYYRKGLREDVIGKFYKDMRRGIYKTDELTSRVQSSAVPKILSELLTEHKNDEDKIALDLCLTTNMIQVGIDIQRLALMTIVGQPKTTSEYIQASSRVGRDQEKPGLVLNILSPFRPRDRSHFEKFHSYHENLYKFVEPTSITSHSDPVRSRCLHAIVIGLSRLWGETSRVNPDIPDQKLKDKIKKYILDYVKKADEEHEEELEKTEREINYIFEKWENSKPQQYGLMVPASSQSSNSILMVPAGSELPAEGDPFETLTSMRNVDKECNAEIITSYRGKQ